MKKIIVIGCPGSGKSTFSRKLHDVTGLPLFYLDMIYHRPDKTTISRDEFDEKLSEILKNNTYIIDGNYGRTIEVRIKECDTVFLFDLPTEVCLDGIRSRLGTKREEMPWTETELDMKFIERIIDFPKTKLPVIYDMLKKYSDKEVHIFKSRDEADLLIESLK